MKQVMEITKQIAMPVTIMAAVVVAVGGWNGYVKVQEKALHAKAVNECAQVAISRWEDTKTGSQVTEPYRPAYEQCLKDKGY